MRFVTKIKRLVGNVFRRRHLETTLDAELRAYLEEMTERKVREGVGPTSVLMMV
jgi:hypothetical protein